MASEQEDLVATVARLSKDWHPELPPAEWVQLVWRLLDEVTIKQQEMAFELARMRRDASKAEPTRSPTLGHTDICLSDEDVSYLADGGDPINVAERLSDACRAAQEARQLDVSKAEPTDHHSDVDDG